VSRPSIAFDKEGFTKQFGLGNEKTVFSFGVINAVIAVLCMYLFTIIDLVFHQKKV
jgi:hypothetical protein